MGSNESPALQVIVLGSGGGPQESNVTAFLVRSVAQEWRRGSMVAVDAGVHLSVITRLIREATAALPADDATGAPRKLTTGPFAGLPLPHSSIDANAAHVTNSLVDTFLITHPHLDHISGFVINTAGLPGTRPKKLAGLPSTIQAFKTHIFNNIIWPNLSDENNGAGLLTYLRLVEGGSPALGDGEGRGYLEVCDGLLVKTYGVSHGHCIEKHSHRGSTSSASTRFGSLDTSYLPGRRDTLVPMQSMSRAQTLLSQATFGVGGSSQAGMEQDRFCVYDSSAYFIRDHDHQKEVLMFGDVEPDSISLSPRNLLIWQDAAPKIVAGTLAAIFIECSYDESQSQDRLFGHLKPVYVIEELQNLAFEVAAVRREAPQENLRPKKRKRTSMSVGGGRFRDADDGADALRRPSAQETGPTPAPSSGVDEPVSPRTLNSDPLAAAGSTGPGQQHPTTPHLATPTDELSLREMDARSPGGSAIGHGPLEGLKVVIIHVKERLIDGPDIKKTILAQLRDLEQEAQLGCEFIMAESGQSFYF
jgi:cAMP phosphodiesterase